MKDLQAESEFFHDIARDVIALVQNSSKEMAVFKDKGVGDYSTQVDVDSENLIVSEINKRFPGDQVLAEEGHSDTSISDGRIWVIDPICGTSNLGKGINNFCTNIALVKGGQVIASCVVDHSQDEYFWSIGGGQVFVNDKTSRPPAPELGLKIDLDLSAIRGTTSETRQKYNNCLVKLINDTSYELISLNTSLGFAYAAIGKTDGFISVFNYPWDIAASSFLVQQVGGVLTALDGSPWTITSVGAIAGRTPAIHKELLDLFLDS